MKIFKIAVTGGAASGKSTVCGCLEKNGFPVISLDAISREVVMPGTPVYGRIVEHFGKGVVAGDGALDRAGLRERIIRDPGEKKVLESFVQPAILKIMNERIEAREREGKPAVVVEVPLLFESGLEKKFDLSVLVAVSRENQIRRLSDRDGVSGEQARGLVDIQMPLEEKIKRAHVILYNDSTPEALCRSTEEMIEKHIKKTILMPKDT